MSTVNLNSLKQDYDEKVDYVKRMIKLDPNKKSYWKAFLHGIYAAIDHTMQHYLDLKDFPKMKQVKAKHVKGNKYFSKVAEIEIFDKVYNIYLDDYGQCYSLELEKDHYIGLGTFNIIVEPDIVYLVFRDIHNKTLDDLNDIK